MRYETEVIRGKFAARPNRFIAHVLVHGKQEVCHVKNTGRCKELLVPGAEVYLAKSSNPLRKTLYDLIAVEKKRENGLFPLLINMDSQIPNDAAEEYFRSGALFPAGTPIRREVTVGNSRFDFKIGEGADSMYIEVKGVTLEQDGVALFPDAPTERGVKHIRELINCTGNGLKAALFFVIQMKGVTLFRPHAQMHPEFAEALRSAQKAGVKIFAHDCIITPESITIADPVRIEL